MGEGHSFPTARSDHCLDGDGPLAQRVALICAELVGKENNKFANFVHKSLKRFESHKEIQGNTSFSNLFHKRFTQTSAEETRKSNSDAGGTRPRTDSRIQPPVGSRTAPPVLREERAALGVP
jgi:hypothetical protein